MKVRIPLLVETHADGLTTASALGLPGPGPQPRGQLPATSSLAAYGSDVPAVIEAVRRAVIHWAEDLDPDALAELRFAPDLRLETVTVPVEALGHDDRPIAAVPRRFAAVLAAPPREPAWGCLPRLGLQVIAEDATRALAELAREAAAALTRDRALRAVERLAELEPATGFRLEWVEADVVVRTPVEVLAAERTKDEKARAAREREDTKVLESVATDLVADARRRHVRAYEQEPLVAELLAFLRGSDERALVLVGPGGVGKTTILLEAARRFGDESRRPFVWATGARLVAGMSRVGEWQERCRAVVDALDRAKGVLACGDPTELVDCGRALGFDVSLAQYLKRPLEQGRLRLVGEATLEAWELLERRDRGFAGLFRVVRVEEPDRARTLAILEKLEAPRRVRVAPEGLEATHDLHARLAPYESFPGKAVRFLERLERLERPATLGREEITRAFSKATGVPLLLLSDERRVDPDSLRSFLEERVVGQPAATRLASDLVARVKAGVADPRRPLGSFLFLGPTGVGKTETAKALAELIFGSRERIVRLDMTEYQDDLAAARLAGSLRRAEGGDLTRRVRAAPLSVVLLDEVEKVHPSVFDLLLQVLGEARLTDGRGRVTDFRSAIVILTSNLGADLPEGSPGFEAAGSSRGSADRFLRATESFFRPELLNRLDAVVPFDPLSREAIDAIAGREIAKALSRDGLARRATRVEVDPAVRARVLAAGFHPRFGARPLKRAIEATIVRPLAHHLSTRATPPAAVRVGLSERGDPEVQVLAPGRERAALVPAGALELVAAVSAVRRSLGTLSRSDLVSDLRETVRDLERTLRAATQAGEGDAHRARHRTLKRGAAALAGLDLTLASARDLEDLASAVLLESDATAAADLGPDARALEHTARLAEILLHATRFDPGDAVFLRVSPIAGTPSALEPLVDLYRRFAEAHGFEATLYSEVHRAVVDGQVLAPAWRKGAGGDAATGTVGLLVSGEACVAWLASEAGRHRIVATAPPARGKTGAAPPQAPDRYALVASFPLETQDGRPSPKAVAALLPEVHAVRVEGRKRSGLLSEMPAVVRVYDERHASIRDPRTGVTREGLIQDASGVAALEAIAHAWLGREGA